MIAVGFLIELGKSVISDLTWTCFALANSKVLDKLPSYESFDVVSPLLVTIVIADGFLILSGKSVISDLTWTCFALAKLKVFAILPS